MKNILLNLDRSPDRLTRMTEQFNEYEINFERFSACDLSRETPDLPYYNRVMRKMVAGEFGMLLSHKNILQNLSNDNCEYYVIFEDDIVVSPYLKSFLEDIKYNASIFNMFDILKIEGFSNYSRIDTRFHYSVGKINFYKLISTHWGTAGYIVSKRFSNFLLKIYSENPMFTDHIFIEENMQKYSIRVGP